MKITIYELLGLVKDGKAPKKIKYNYEVFELDDYGHYMLEKRVGYNFEYIDLFDETLNYDLDLFLNDEVEILDEKTYSYTFKKDEKGCFTDKNGNRFSIIPVDEEDEFIDIEELRVKLMGFADDSEEEKEFLNEDLRRITDKINDLIKNQKKIIQALKENK